MNIPRVADRLESAYPFGDTLTALHEEIRRVVETALGKAWRVKEIRSTLQTQYQRPLKSEGEILPSAIPAFLLAFADVSFVVRTVDITKVHRSDEIELTLGVANGELRVFRQDIVTSMF